MRPRLLLLVLALLLIPQVASARSRPHATQPYVVVLDPGHGAGDIGAANASSSEVEKLLTLRVAEASATDLRKMGYRVYLTRRRDQDVNTPPRDVNGDGKINHVDELVARNVFANTHH